MSRFKKQKHIINKYMSVIQNKLGEADFYITGDIVDDIDEYFDGDITPQKILDSLDLVGNIQNLNIHFNSCGGSIIAGNFIKNCIEKYKKDNNVKVIGYISCAISMATGISLVCDHIKIYKNATYMIHKPSSSVWGDANDMRKKADTLDVFENSLVINYLDRFNAGEEKLRELLDNETWLTAQEVVDYGLADELIEPLQMTNSAKGFKIGNVLFESQKITNKLRELNTEIEIEIEKEQDKEENTMKYDESLLNDYGISEESYEAFESILDFMQIVNIKHESEIEKAKNDIKNEMLTDAEKDTNLTEDEIKSIFGEDFETTDKEVIKQELIQNAIRGKRITSDMEKSILDIEKINAENKKMKKDVIDNALENCSKAMGPENYDETMWRKVLNGMNYTDICNTSKSWANKAKEVLNAGVKVSQQKEKVINNTHITQFINGKKRGNK